MNERFNPLKFKELCLAAENDRGNSASAELVHYIMLHWREIISAVME